VIMLIKAVSGALSVHGMVSDEDHVTKLEVTEQQWQAIDAWQKHAMTILLIPRDDAAARRAWGAKDDQMAKAITCFTSKHHYRSCWAPV